MIKFSCGYFIFGDFWAEFQSKSASFQFLEGQIHKIFFAPKLLYVIYVQHTSGKTDWCISQMIKSYHQEQAPYVKTLLKKKKKIQHTIKERLVNKGEFISLQLTLVINRGQCLVVQKKEMQGYKYIKKTKTISIKVLNKWYK